MFPPLGWLKRDVFICLFHSYYCFLGSFGLPSKQSAAASFMWCVIDLFRSLSISNLMVHGRCDGPLTFGSDQIIWWLEQLQIQQWKGILIKRDGILRRRKGETWEGLDAVVLITCVFRIGVCICFIYVYIHIYMFGKNLYSYYLVALPVRYYYINLYVI